MLRVTGFVLASLLAVACSSDGANVSDCAPMAKFAYQDFGPQSMAYDFIGYEMWQWQEQGGGDPAAEYPISVIVFADGQDAAAKLKFPVDEPQKKDFRYVPYKTAVDYVDENLADVKAMEKEGMAMGDLQSTLENTKTRIIKEVCEK